MRIDQVADAIVAKLKAAGLPASVDPRDVNPPAVWVQLDRVAFDRFDIAWSGDWILWLIAPDAGTAPALRTLGALADQVWAVYPTITAGAAQAITLPAGGDPLPALRFSLHLKATDDPDPTETGD